MPDSILPNEFVTFVHYGGIPVTIVRREGIFVRVIGYGGKPVTFVHHGGIPVVVDSERLLPEEVKQDIGY